MNTSSTEDSPFGADIIHRFMAVSPYVSHLGIQLISIQSGVATLILPFKESLVTVGTIMHGGALASLIDTAATVAAWSGVEVPTSGRGTTANLTVSYLAPTEREDVQAIARVLRRGRNLVFLDVEVIGTSGRAIARGLVTYKLG